MNRSPIPQIDPVVIMLDGVAEGGRLGFSGIDLEDGSRVSVTVTRLADGPIERPTHEAQGGLVLVLSIETLAPHH